MILRLLSMMTSLPKRNRKLDGGGGLPSATFFHLGKVVAMKNLEIDIETYSSTNLQKSGVYRYVEANDFEAMLLFFSLLTLACLGGSVRGLMAVQRRMRAPSASSTAAKEVV
mgnify:CR=1 FL=1